MRTEVNFGAVYIPSDDVVAREIEGEIIIVPLVTGIGDMEDELYTLNETGRAIWTRLDGLKNLKNIMEELSEEFEARDREIKEDVTGFVEELLKRKILIEASGD